MNLPKRRKSKDNPYSLVIENNTYIVVFDKNKIEVSKEVFELFNEFELEDISQMHLDQYYKNFLRGNIYRENCYECNYAKRERISDITIGDFWGLSKDSKINDDIKAGISSVIILTEKGLQLINKILPIFLYEERTYEEVYLHNEQLNNPMKKKKQYFIYKDNYLLKGFKRTFKKMNLSKDYFKYNPIIYNIFKKEK